MPRRRIYSENGSGKHVAEKTNHPAEGAPIVRCAIYTRKSTSEGLDQAFNSLDAQRESCEAYIASQKALGWQAIPTRYDDGGFTGGNIERPAVQQLLDDVTNGRIDCVVVYKVDRLSRSLMDFARIIKLFEDRNIHFVSVTQHFNTADSMGRLTLNILLSFAQFEREIIAERTRDKIAAARRRGQWAGGRPILGYDLVPGEHRLIVNPAEADQVRAIFRVYLEKESILSTAQAFNARGWTTKRWTAAKGNIIGGRPFDRPNLHHLLTNVAYIGRVRHRDETYAGQHKAIIDSGTWDKVQRLLRRNKKTAGSFLRNKHGALLKGLLRCKACDAAMVQMVSRKGIKLHRYYVCTKAQKRGYDQCPTGTILARPLEQEVCRQLRETVTVCIPPRTMLGGDSFDKSSVPPEVEQFLACDWDNLPPPEQARLIRFVVQTVEYDCQSEKATLTLADEVAAGQAPSVQSCIAFTIGGLKPTSRKRQQPVRELRPVTASVENIVLAYQIEEAVRSGRAANYADVAQRLVVSRARISQVMRMLTAPPHELNEMLVNADGHDARGNGDLVQVATATVVADDSVTSDDAMRRSLGERVSAHEARRS